MSRNLKFLELFSISMILSLILLLSNSPAASARIKIIWWHAMNGKLGEVVNELANRFNASQKEYEVVPIYKGSYEDTMAAGIAAFRAHKAPDIIQIFDAGAATIIAAKVVYPVADLLAKYGVKFNANDYISGVRYFYADANGKMIGCPFNSSAPVLYYNKDAFKKAGIKKPPETWEEFEKIAPALKKAGYIGFSESHSPWIFAENFMSRHNLQIADKDNGFKGFATKLYYENPAMVYHWTKLREWIKKGYFKYYGRGWAENEQPFLDQKVAMWLGSSGSLGGLRKVAKFHFGVAFLPYWKKFISEGAPTFIGGAALFVFKGKSDKKYRGIAKFLQFLTKPEIQYYWHKETGYLPVTKAAYNLAIKDGYYKRVPGAQVGIKEISLPPRKWTKGYRLGNYVQIREVMFKEFEKILNGKETAKEGLANIDREGEKLLREFAQTYK